MTTLFLRGCCAVGLLLGLGATLCAVEPEELMPQKSLFYARYDGIKAHQAAFDATIFGKLMKEDLGKLIAEIERKIIDSLGPQQAADRLLEGADPAELLEIQAAAEQVPQVIEHLKNHGLAASAEEINPLNEQFQVTLVFPQAGAKKIRSAFLGLFQLAVESNGREIQEKEVQGRTVLVAETPNPKLFARMWGEGQHLVYTVGSEPVEYTLELLEGKRENLTKQPLYQNLTDSPEFETYLRAYVDTGTISERAGKIVPFVAPLLKDLGADGLKSVSLAAGMKGPYQRLSLRLNAPERRGVLSLLKSYGPVDMKKLPPLPPNLTTLNAARINPGEFYGDVLETIKKVLKYTPIPDDEEMFASTLEEFEDIAGLDIKEELFGTLGETLVYYNAPSEGPFSLGSVLALEVKQPQNLKAALERFIVALGRVGGVDVSVQPKEYRGKEFFMVKVEQPGFFFSPTYTIQDGWLVVSLYPQPVQGFLLRSEGYERWEIPQVIQKIVPESSEDSSQEVTTVMYLDPRPSIKEVCSVAPLFVSAVSSFSGEFDFDVSLIPNAQAMNEHLTPNVCYSIDDGKEIRLECYSSFPLPGEVTGIQSYSLFILPFSFAF